MEYASYAIQGKELFPSVFSVLKTGSQDQNRFYRNTHKILHTEQKAMKGKWTIHLAQKLILTTHFILKDRIAGKLEWEQSMCMHVHQFCW
jgi:hypothetical protein